MGSAVIPPLGPLSDAAMRGSAQRGFDVGQQIRQPEQEQAQNKTGPAVYTAHMWRHPRLWGDRTPYPFPSQFEAAFIKTQKLDFETELEVRSFETAHMRPIDGGFPWGVGQGIPTKEDSGAALGLTALNEYLARIYIGALLKARTMSNNDYKRWKVADGYTTLPKIFEAYRFAGIVFSQAPLDGAYADIAANLGMGLSGLPIYYVTTLQCRNNRIKMIDYTDGAGLMNGATLYIVLRYCAVDAKTVYSFDMLTEYASSGSKGRFPLDKNWFAPLGIESLMVPQFCIEARPQHDVRTHTHTHLPLLTRTHAVAAPGASSFDHYLSPGCRRGARRDRGQWHGSIHATRLVRGPLH
jgi:hypothetical protein